jgi:hypothetical protein
MLAQAKRGEMQLMISHEDTKTHSSFYSDEIGEINERTKPRLENKHNDTTEGTRTSDKNNL